MILRLSPTQIGMFFRCAAAYLQRYILKRKVPPGIALIIGSGVDEAANVNFNQKKSTNIDLPMDMFEDAAADAFMKRLSSDGLMLEREQASRAKAFIAESKDKTVDMARVLCEEVAPKIQPIAVQSNVDFTRDATPNIIYTGKLDVMDETHDVIDVKTSKNRWPKNKAAAEDQPTFYLEGVRQTFGAKPKKFVYHIITKGKEPSHQEVETNRDESDLVTLEERAKTMTSMIKAGLFPPCDPGSWGCSPVYCGFYLAGCKYISKRKKMAYINREV